eukprot:GFUD01003831.1.p1 GENE.GFUD01003831.1~~GFUD01003831.1.p1  ORF type:complete len:379 (+),score=95.32 GFUD01003831.1:120-1256(+)
MEHKNEGNVCYKQKKYTEATECYLKAIEEDPSNYIFYSNLAAAVFEKGNYESCIFACKKAIEVGTENKTVSGKQVAKIHARLGRAYVKLADFKNAADSFVAAVEHHKTDDNQNQLSEAIMFLKLSSDPAVEVRESSVHSRGVFAVRDISKGQPVCFYDGQLVDRSNIFELVSAEGIMDKDYWMSHPRNPNLNLFGYKTPKSIFGIGQLINDGAKPEITKLNYKQATRACEEYFHKSHELWNISFKPTGPDFWFYADRDITEGEELYLQYGWRSWLEMLTRRLTSHTKDAHIWRLLYWAILGQKEYVLPDGEVKQAKYAQSYVLKEDEYKDMLEELFEVPTSVLENARKRPKFTHKKFFLTMLEKIQPEPVESNLDQLP